MDIKSITLVNPSFNAKIKLKRADLEKIRGAALVATGASTIVGPISGSVANIEGNEISAQTTPYTLQIYGNVTATNVIDSCKGDGLATISTLPTAMTYTIAGMSIYDGVETLKEELKQEKKDIPS